MSLVLRDGVDPEFGYALVFMSIFVCLWTVGAYYASNDMQEPIMIKTFGGYSVIDSDSWKVFLVPDVIFIIITMLCFRFKSQSFTDGIKN